MSAFGPSRLAVRAVVLLAGVVLSAAPALACSVCYGNAAATQPMISGARLGVFLLLGITAAVLGGFAKFFLYLRNRALKAESEGIASEWAQLQRSSPL